MLPLIQARLSRPDEDYSLRWRRTLLFALPFGITAFLVGWLLDGPSGQSTVYDAVTYPIMTGVLTALMVMLAISPKALRLVVFTIVGGCSLFFSSKLIYLLFFGMEPHLVIAELTETFFWVPVVYLLGFIFSNLIMGRMATTWFTIFVLLVSGAYVLLPMVESHLSVIYAIVQLNLANTVLLGLTQAFIGFRESYTRTQTRLETAERFASIDVLTELPNRFSLQNRLVAALERSRELGNKAALLFIDVDGFKVLNDTLGHEAGDQLLKQMAERFKRMLRRDDFLARISGDEFVLLIENVEDPQAAFFVARKLQAELVQPFHVRDQAFCVTASIGISVFPDDADDPEALLRHADSAMYRVKRSGKNDVQQYRGDADDRLERERALEAGLRDAIAEGQLSLMYQPLHDLDSGEIRKFEALLRWNHPTLGHVAPSEFVPVAEHSGLIVSLGTWALNEACRQAKAWQRLSAKPIQVCVNVSPLQFAQPNFYTTVVHALEANELMPDAIQLELTETMVLHGVEHVTTTLARLQRLGVGLAIDDFGTGYSSLAYLRDLPIDTVKIDRAFIKDLGAPRKGPQFALALVEAITSLATHLDLDVVAEGIETRAQCEILKSLGCRTGQGYYFARPMPAADIDVYLRPRDAVPSDSGQWPSLSN